MKNLVKLFQKNSGFLRAKEIGNRTQWRELHKMLTDNSVYRIKRGLYRLNEFKHDTSFVEASHVVPTGVLCMFSAWYYYDLTTTIPHENHLAVKQNKKVKFSGSTPIKLYYLSEQFYHLGISQICVDNHSVKIYDMEKSVCDAVRFRNKVGMDIAIEVVKNYVRRKDRDLNKLAQYAEPLRILKIMQNMIMPIL